MADEKRSVGRPKIPKYVCACCGEIKGEKDFYTSDSVLFQGRVPYCKDCIIKLYNVYRTKYFDEGHLTPEKDAIRRLCMAFDIYYTDAAYDSAVKYSEKNPTIPLVSSYFKTIKLTQYARKTYEDTIVSESGFRFVFNTNDSEVDIENTDELGDSNETVKVDKKLIKFWGKGLTPEDYQFLQEEYDDWTSRHECNTKSQEEIFKAISFNRWKAHNANLGDGDTKDLDRTFKDLLDMGKLQPKQNKEDALADTQTFGTLIDQWENKRPIPEVDPQLKDVDKLGLFIDVFFRGHLAKMMGLKNGVSRFYDEYMKKYTVIKPQRKNNNGKNLTPEDDSETIFNTIFGSASSIEGG